MSFISLRFFGMTILALLVLSETGWPSECHDDSTSPQSTLLALAKANETTRAVESATRAKLEQVGSGVGSFEERVTDLGVKGRLRVFYSPETKVAALEFQPTNFDLYIKKLEAVPGVVRNIQSGNLICGNQRISRLESPDRDAWLRFEKKENETPSGLPLPAALNEEFSSFAPYQEVVRRLKIMKLEFSSVSVRDVDAKNVKAIRVIGYRDLGHAGTGYFYFLDGKLAAFEFEPRDYKDYLNSVVKRNEQFDPSRRFLMRPDGIGIWSRKTHRTRIVFGDRYLLSRTPLLEFPMDRDWFDQGFSTGAAGEDEPEKSMA